MLKKEKRQLIEFLWEKSLERAACEQKLAKEAELLGKIVPDITNQYSLSKLGSSYAVKKVRYMHAFQVALVKRVLAEFEAATIVDIGDSSGTHLQYITALNNGNKKIKCLSVNLDAQAVKKIKEKGLVAIQARAEELTKLNINADIFLCLEIVEHLTDPCRFLYDLSIKSNAKYIIMTVPYLKKSRVGLHHIRQNRTANLGAENTHIFELNPSDWKLLIKHSGWKPVHEEIYLQYPKKHILSFTKALWRRFDYEGFYGLILEKDDSWSSKYPDW